MRLIALLFVTTYLFASDFPDIFSSAGDEVFENMQRYQRIKDLQIYKDRPEILEAYCADANKTMQKGFSLDQIKNDPEHGIDKGMIKSYAKELRVLGEQNNKIKKQLGKDISALYEQGDFKALRTISEAGFVLNKKMMQAIEEDAKKESIASEVSVVENVSVTKKIQEQEVPLAPVAVSIPLPKPLPTPVPVPPAPELVMEEKKEIPRETKPEVLTKKLTELEYYKISLMNFKEELYALRENGENNASVGDGLSVSGDTKMACLNDITAINYWMINVLENENDNCLLRDAIKQMKSYDKAAMSSCGRESMRYIEWHGRIKPYVGKRLFEAEAGCLN